MRKFTIIIIVIAMMGSLLVACNNTTDETKYTVTKEEYDLLKSLGDEDINMGVVNQMLEFEYLMRVIEYCNNSYYYEVDFDELDEILAQSFVNGLDRYSYLLPMSSVSSQTTTGIGLTLNRNIYNEISIVTIIPDTPAANAISEVGGYTLERGDRIYAINDTRVEGASSYLFNSLSVGGAGTELKLTIYRDDAELGDFNCTKTSDVFKQAYYINNLGGSISNSVGYICLKSFNDSVDDFVAAITQFEADGNEQLILDLRGNGGGSSAELTAIASYLVDDAEHSESLPIVEYKTKDNIISAYSTSANNFINKPIVVLVNSETASASEALIGGMQYYNTCTVVGTTTFGKGTACNSGSILMSPDGAYVISVVMAEYYLYTDDLETYPTGRWCIDGIGITPDVEITDWEFENEFNDDKYIVEAIEVLFPTE